MYNYKESILEDVTNAINEYIEYHKVDLEEVSRRSFEEKMNDVLWTEDSVTGNGSGSYTFCTATAEEYLNGNWDLAREAMEEFGFDGNPFEKGPEWVDVTIRCYLLSSAISEVLDEIMG